MINHSSSETPHNNPPRRRPSSLDCPICLSLMTDPVVARCGHSFCSPCITTYLAYPDKRPRHDSPRFTAKQNGKPCPVCENALARTPVYPNTALASMVHRARATAPQSPQSPQPPQSPSQSIDLRNINDHDADRLLTQLLERKRLTASTRERLGVDILIPFLEKCRSENRATFDQINADLQLIDADLATLRRNRTNSHSTPSPDAPPHIPLLTPRLMARNSLISRYHDNVKTAYFESRRTRGPDALSPIIHMLVDATSVSHIRKRVTIQHIDILRTNHNLISSIEFNASSNIFATAGVTKRIKLFEFNALIESSVGPDSTATHHYPILEIPTQSKLSCLSWSRARTSVLASSTYKGDILIHDTETNTHLQSLREHTKRTWYVDFSTLNPALLLSGSDDNTVKLWDIDRQPASTMTLQAPANVCCVKFNPYESNEFAFGSADHNVYSYDLRHPKTPLCVFEGHWRAVSHVLFLNRSELISASTDSSCKLWNVEKQEPGLSYGGHSNDRNFVGLCGSKDFFACGSEDNSVYVYHKGFAGPVVRYGFGSGGGFVSTVAWKPQSQWIVAANNAGSVEVLELL